MNQKSSGAKNHTLRIICWHLEKAAELQGCRVCKRKEEGWKEKRSVGSPQAEVDIHKQC
ncbi:uncharacterized protein TRIVIDRAFT_187017 [Trichoderma virens Gv29-8]|uniref:Uncharacterized protein n=1 Tax=Hypocrea virens (strain Gv29-8 / FGSC 10586) TaxID=413071 RepID=G9N306_HYPVG|nr:uncharacterized protein TRIVIDRAFT_187017 [Trichoderma virens Gv29-8]EHK18691.1 hypothetical protein TRIVIDRAFT_187017 [Trichoderma virens Gv29-8]